MESNKYHILRIPQGPIRGCTRKTLYGADYFSFEGIPYAEPPLGTLRFRAPVPAGCWLTLRDCTEFNVKPMQKNPHGVIEGSEDCLYLNVYCKTINAETKLPVMVWIYGGGFSTGNCTKDKYGPDYLMEEHVILVTFNYRLSVLGFLSLADPSLNVPGNAGLKDQVLALKWVKENIACFGGDVNNITLFGESAGGASVHYMLSTERTRHLFQKAICQSGCILNNWAFSEDVINLSYPLACLKGYNGARDDRCILQFLQSLPPEKIIDVDELNDQARLKRSLYAFVPCQEPYASEEAVITKPLGDLLKSAWGNEIPLIIGGVSFEGLIMYPRLKKNLQIMKSLCESPQSLLPKPLPLDNSLMPQISKHLDSLIDVHFEGKGLSGAGIMQLLDYFSYRLFNHAFHRVIKARQLYAQAPTFQYRFDFDSPTFNHHRNRYCGDEITTGVAHADDLAYLFYSNYSWKLDTETAEFLTIQRMVKIWTTFAKTGNPNCKYIENWEDVKTAGENKWLNIGRNLCFEDVPSEVQKKLNVWNSMYGENLIG